MQIKFGQGRYGERTHTQFDNQTIEVSRHLTEVFEGIVVHWFEFTHKGKNYVGTLWENQDEMSISWNNGKLTGKTRVFKRDQFKIIK